MSSSATPRGKAPRTPTSTAPGQPTPQRRNGYIVTPHSFRTKRLLHTPGRPGDRATPRSALRRKPFLRTERETPLGILRTLSRVLVEREISEGKSHTPRTPRQRRAVEESERLVSTRKMVRRINDDRASPSRHSLDQADDSFYLANPRPHSAFLDGQTAEISPTETRARRGSKGRRSGSSFFARDESVISVGKSPEGARRVIPNPRRSFGEFRLDNDLDFTHLGLDADTSAHLSSVFGTLGEARTKAAFAEIEQMNDEDEPSEDVQALIESVKNTVVEDSLNEFAIGAPPRRLDFDDLDGAFQFDIPDQYQGQERERAGSTEDQTMAEDDNDVGRSGIETAQQFSDGGDGSETESKPASLDVESEQARAANHPGTLTSGPMDLDPESQLGPFSDYERTVENFAFDPAESEPEPEPEPGTKASEASGIGMPGSPSHWAPAAPPTALDHSTFVAPVDASALSANRTGPSLSPDTTGPAVGEEGEPPGPKRAGLPKPLIKRLASTFLQRAGGGGGGPARLSAETVDALALASDWFFEQAAEDLGAYAEHAGRKGIDEADVAMLMSRQRVTRGRSLFAIANEMLPRELVRLVRPGGKVRKRR